MSADPLTTLYLIRHGATDASHGRPPLARLGVRQAEATRDFLAIRPIDFCYTSPLLRAAQTARIVAAPHGLTPVPLDALADATAAPAALEGLLARHAGYSLLVVAHHAVHRVYLAALLGLTAEQAGLVSLDNCGISVVHRRGGKTAVGTLNAAFHLQGVA